MVEIENYVHTEKQFHFSKITLQTKHRCILLTFLKTTQSLFQMVI